MPFCNDPKITIHNIYARKKRVNPALHPALQGDGWLIRLEQNFYNQPNKAGLALYYIALEQRGNLLERRGRLLIFNFFAIMNLSCPS